jgi:hypothetical protein
MEDNTFDVTPKKQTKDILDINLSSFEGVSKFQSIRRAIKRGGCTLSGIVVARRPFDNSKNSCKRGNDSRSNNSYKKAIHGKVRE